MRRDPIRVSVVVPTHDRPDWLRQSLTSIRSIDGPDLELDVIVIDDSDATGAEPIAREFGARLLKPAGRGAAAARNAGLRAATGEFIAFLDDDDVWLPDHLRPHLAAMQADSGLDAVVSQIRNADSHLSRFGPAWPAGLPDGADLFRAFYTFFPQIGATVVRSTALKSVGYQNESLDGAEDWDWHLRLALKRRVGFVPVASVGYRMRPAGSDDDVIMGRLRYHRYVFWSNALRAGRRSPSAPALLRAWLRQRGQFAGHLIASAGLRSGAGDVKAARRALRRAFVASAPHAARAVISNPGLRALIVPRRALGAPQAVDQQRR